MQREMILINWQGTIEFLQAHFSHHNLGRYLDTAILYLDMDAEKHQLSYDLLDTFDLAVWYCFYDNLRTQTSSVLYTVDETTYNVSGNIIFLVNIKIGV